jgi:hypothetical protein
MEASWFASMLLHPVAVVALVVVVSLSSVLLLKAGGPRFPIARSQLLFGYLGATVICIVVAGVSSYVPPEEALSKWHVPPENYWEALRNEFTVLLVLFMYAALIGIALVGAPIIFALARAGRATAPWLLLTSVIISLVGAWLLVQINQPSSASFMRDAPYIAGLHFLVALGFCVGARLPWRSRPCDESP